MGAMVLRLNTLLKGYSGVRECLLTLLRDLINAGVAPYIPTRGSVGASGDLIHLGHLALTLIGEGKAYYQGELMEAAKAFKKAKLKPLKPSYKEAIALINGTSVMSAIAAFAIHNAKKSLKAEIIAAGFGMEVFSSIDDSLDEALHQTKPHRGQMRVAAILRDLLHGSKNIVTRHKIHERVREQKHEDGMPVFETSVDVQDVYSLRCTPQVLAPVYEAIEMCERVIEIEANSTNDNPVVVPDKDQIYHGGNFHGQSVGFYMDVLAVALSTLSNIAERRLNKLLDTKLNQQLPEFLIAGVRGLDMGFMGVQYLATSTTAENRQLANPVSTNTISTNAANQDVVSMGTIAARKVYTQARNTHYILTVELLADMQALHFQNADGLAPKMRNYYERLAGEFEVYKNDKIFHDILTRFMDLVFESDILDDLSLFEK